MNPDQHTFKSLICDSDYKCLIYEECSQQPSCDVYQRIHRKAKLHYTRHSTQKKIKKNWTDENPSVREIKSVYRKSLQSGFRCVYCNLPMTLDTDFENSSTIDHIRARFLGGDTSEKNMVVCCKRCNNKKNVIEMNTPVRKCRLCKEIKNVSEFYKKHQECNHCIAGKYSNRFDSTTRSFV